MSIKNALQMLAVATIIPQRKILPYICVLLYFYLLCTPLWWLSLLYLCWMYLDRNTCEMGGRYNRWVLNWSYWRSAKDYFPTRLLCVPGFTLDPNRNYLFCCFPHGVIPTGANCSLLPHQSDFHQLFPNFMVKLATMNIYFFLPFFRELELARGYISCSRKSLNCVLSKPEGSHIVVLFPGGIAEAFNTHPGKYKFVLKNRRGFVKLALKNGSPLVPVITFGENDLFKLVKSPFLKKMQPFIEKRLKGTLLLFHGRGFFQNYFGVIPWKRALTTVVGMPIEVTKVENPTIEEVEVLHQKFIQELINLFENYKYELLENPEETHLEFQ